MAKEMELTECCHSVLVDSDTKEYCPALRFVDITEDCPGVKAALGCCTILYVQTANRGVTAHLWVQRYPGNEPAWGNFSPISPTLKDLNHKPSDTLIAWREWYRSGKYVSCGPSGYLPDDHFAGWARWLGLTKRKLRNLIVNNKPSTLEAAA